MTVVTALDLSRKSTCQVDSYSQANLTKKNDLYLRWCCNRVVKTVGNHNKPVYDNWAILLKFLVPVLIIISGSK